MSSGRHRSGCMRIIAIDPLQTCRNLSMYETPRTAQIPAGYVCVAHAGDQAAKFRLLPPITNPIDLKLWDENGILREEKTR